MPGFLRGALWGLAAVLVVAQFIRPARTNPVLPPGHALQDVVLVPLPVQGILARSCADCHSNLTQWPWYSNVAPISWFVINHVEEGRRHLNLSEWVRPGVNDPVQYAQQKFHSACREVDTGAMPLKSYLLIHRDARLSAADVQSICTWADQVTGFPQISGNHGR